MKRTVSVWALSTLGRLGLPITLVAVACDVADVRSPEPAAESTPTAEQTSSSDSVTDDPGDIPFHPPFTQYPDDPGATQFEDLNAAQQEAIMLMAERTDYGSDVHRAWSRVTGAKTNESKLQRAAYQSGTDGLADVGLP
jgi:hypothetical protein